LHFLLNVEAKQDRKSKNKADKYDHDMSVNQDKSSHVFESKRLEKDCQGNSTLLDSTPRNPYKTLTGLTSQMHSWRKRAMRLLTLVGTAPGTTQTNLCD